MKWIVRQTSCHTKFQCFASAKDSRTEHEFLCYVWTHQPRKHQRTCHVRDQTPMHFTNGQLSVGMHDANVSSKCHLQSSPKGVAVNCGDHRNRNFLPNPTHLLGQVCNPTIGHISRINTRCHRIFRISHCLKRSKVEPGTKRCAFSGKYDGPNI